MRNKNPDDALHLRLVPMNLSAAAAVQVIGNPDISRPESAVGNCSPGLELDHRNLERRFFPGLIFSFLDDGGAANGVKLVGVDAKDDSLTTAEKEELKSQEELLKSGAWFIKSVKQGDQIVELFVGSEEFLEGSIAWRIIRSLDADRAIEIVLHQRGQVKGPEPLTLKREKRRNFVDRTTGVIHPVYQPGELTQSLCSPWQHDFRDCTCTYWASNHPDISISMDIETDEEAVTERLIWLRHNRNVQANGRAVSTGARKRELDYFEINQRWQDLAIVLEEKEISAIYTPGPERSAAPFSSVRELVEKLTQLAGIELALTLEYLYARYSISSFDNIPPQNRTQEQNHAFFIRHELLVIATSEMKHLRWANQILWELWRTRKIVTKPDVVLEPGLKVPAQGRKDGRDRALRILNEKTIDDFVAAEAGSGTLEGQYARVLATLSSSRFTPRLAQLASRIIADGSVHYTRFREIRAVLSSYDFKPAFLIELKSKQDDADARAAIRNYKNIVEALRTAYGNGDLEDARIIDQARTFMFDLDDAATRAATRAVGVDFF